jgi:hypothetical protein
MQVAQQRLKINDTRIRDVEVVRTSSGIQYASLFPVGAATGRETNY